MASEAISSSIMIIGAVLGAAVLITAILPAIFSAGDTFGTVSSSAEQKLRTDFRIVNTYVRDDGATDTVRIWMKNVGNTQISIYDLRKSDVFLGIGSVYERYGWGDGTSGTFGFTGDNGGYWQIGETLEVFIEGLTIDDIDQLSYTFTLPNSIRRSIYFSKKIA